VKLKAAGLLFLCASASAFAASVTFTFDTQTINGTVVNGLSSGANATAIQNYMNAVLAAANCTGCSVTVLVNGSAIGAVVDQTYNGEGHVTGPGSGSKSLTLGTSDGATASNTNSTVNSTYDSFIANTNDSSGNVSQQITLQFHNITGLTLTGFDYEIFPDGTCPVLNTANCGALSGGHYANQPDLIFEAGNNTNGTDTVQTTFWGVTPGTTNGTSTKSPLGTELAPQAIGTWTGSLSGATEFDFVDWPATIGLDNIAISYSNNGGGGNGSVPEPMSLALLGTVVGGLLLNRKFRKA
jgi:hypothetical protein